ncbi:MAG: hypothetical protein J7K36_02995 [Archaeoglobaceae archaeon]|nr:hypothetical protein [Archaeoglobaceae archaeon]
MNELNEINKELAEFEEELSKLKSASEMIEESKNAAQATISESKKLNESAQKLLNAVNILMSRLDKVDFPTRLDKLDNSVTGINTAIQNIFGRFETIEKNLKDEFNSKISILQEKQEKNQKMNLVFLILILLFVGSSLLTLLFKFGF